MLFSSFTTWTFRWMKLLTIHSLHTKWPTKLCYLTCQYILSVLATGGLCNLRSLGKMDWPNTLSSVIWTPFFTCWTAKNIRSNCECCHFTMAEISSFLVKISVIFNLKKSSRFKRRYNRNNFDAVSDCKMAPITRLTIKQINSRNVWLRMKYSLSNSPYADL